MRGVRLEIPHFASDDSYCARTFDEIASCGRVRVPFVLHPKGLHCRPFACVQDPRMDRSLVCQVSHDPTQRGQLEDELRFARSPYRGVAGHQANLVRVRQDQDYLDTESRCRMSRLDPCVSPSYYDDIRIHTNHPW